MQYAEYFVKSYGWYDEPDWLYITMEYCEMGDLGEHLELKKAIVESEVWEIAGQVLEGLTLMHAEDFAHRDLKPSVSVPLVRTCNSPVLSSWLEHFDQK